MGRILCAGNTATHDTLPSMGVGDAPSETDARCGRCGGGAARCARRVCRRVSTDSARACRGDRASSGDRGIVQRRDQPITHRAAQHRIPPHRWARDCQWSPGGRRARGLALAGREDRAAGDRRSRDWQGRPVRFRAAVRGAVHGDRGRRGYEVVSPSKLDVPSGGLEGVVLETLAIAASSARTSTSSSAATE